MDFPPKYNLFLSVPYVLKYSLGAIISFFAPFSISLASSLISFARSDSTSASSSRFTAMGTDSGLPIMVEGGNHSREAINKLRDGYYSRKYGNSVRIGQNNQNKASMERFIFADVVVY